MKEFLYALRYMILVVLLYYILLPQMYTLSYWLFAIVPVNYIAIKYGIYNKIAKDNYVTKDYILFDLIGYTTLFNTIFLALNNVNFIVIIVVVFVNIFELILLDNPSKDNERLKNNRIKKKK